jgi:hypothetical protein
MTQRTSNDLLDELDRLIDTKRDNVTNQIKYVIESRQQFAGIPATERLSDSSTEKVAARMRERYVEAID